MRYETVIIQDVFGRPMRIRKKIAEPGDMEYNNLGNWSARGMI